MNADSNSTTSETSGTTLPAIRTWRTALWIWFVLILNAILGLLVLYNLISSPSASVVYSLIVSLFYFANAIGAFLILEWKKIGFYIIAGSATFQLVLSPFVGGNIFCTILSPFIFLGFIYYVLQYPKENKAWDHLS